MIKTVRYIISFGMFLFAISIIKTNLETGIIILVLSFISLILAKFNTYI